MNFVPTFAGLISVSERQAFVGRCGISEFYDVTVLTGCHFVKIPLTKLYNLAFETRFLSAQPYPNMIVYSNIQDGGRYRDFHFCGMEVLPKAPRMTYLVAL